MKTSKITPISIIAILVLTICFSCYAIEEQEIIVTTYEETAENISNPDRGFYYPMAIKCKPTGMDKKKTIYHAEGLVHLRLGLRAFSAKGNSNQDYAITSEMLEALDCYMEQIRQAGGCAIIRFAYDDFEGISNLEPEIEQIEKHIAQLTPFFTKNMDVITSVESGFLGPYGEQHSSTMVTRENIKRVVDALLKAVPEERSITVRRPDWYCAVSGVELDKIDQTITTKENPYYRVGIFNDGYLGSSSDLGTYKNREKEIKWIFNQATHTIFGGEAVKVDSIKDTDENGNLYNSPEHMQQEMFLTHTTYLNEYWNDKLIQSWKETKYTGDDQLYQEKTAFAYIQNHLGYRIVLRNSQIPSSIEQNSKLSIQLMMENVGAGNVVNPKDMYLILKKDQEEYAVLLQQDITTLLSKQTKTIEISADIPKNLPIGNYELYIKITNKDEGVQAEKRCIQFANKDIWDTTIKANRIGKIQIVQEEIDKEDNKVNNEINNQIKNEINNQVNNETNNQIKNEINNQVNNETNNQIKNEINNQVNNETNNQIKNEITNQTTNENVKVENKIEQQEDIAMQKLPKTGQQKEDIVLLSIIAILVIQAIIVIRHRIKNRVK